MGLKIETYKKYSQTTRGRAVILFNKIKNRCISKNKGIVSIDVDWIEQKIKNGVCELSGLPFDLAPNNQFHRNPNSPSLDRIDNSNRDYSPENTRVVLTSLNGAINEYGLEHFLKTAIAVLHKQGKYHGRI